MSKGARLCDDKEISQSVMCLNRDIFYFRASDLTRALSAIVECQQCRNKWQATYEKVTDLQRELISAEGRAVLFAVEPEVEWFDLTTLWASFRGALLQYLFEVQPCAAHRSAAHLVDALSMRSARTRRALMEYFAECERGCRYIEEMLAVGDTEEAVHFCDRFLLEVSMNTRLILDPALDYTPLAG